ncbi:MAG TPA: IS21 family transposase [Cyclobacteriaceae bacterium]|jgi:transposase|nr:IS21 family transposase [Cyclobacteriaceae bacterium]
MANKTITMLQIRKILQLLDRGFSQRRIAREVDISRNTVQDYCVKIVKTGQPVKKLLLLGDHELNQCITSDRSVPLKDNRYERLAPRLPEYLKELNRTGVTRLLLWREYCRLEADAYSYQQFCFHLGNHQRIHSAVMHFDHIAGDKAEIDFAGQKLSYVDRQTGEVIYCPVLIGVLPHSGYTYAEPLVNAGMEQLVSSLNKCVEYFGGVPVHIVSDNMKQVVKSANRYEPAFTELINQWSVHYNTTFLAARVARPRDKATVEKAVDLAYKRIYAPLRDKTFFSLEELKVAVNQCLHEHNQALFQKKDFSRYDLHLAEKTSLKPLPLKPFELKYSADAKVQKNYHVTLGQDWHHYSVPFRCIGKRVKIIYDAQVVEIYDGLNRIALHKRDYRKHVHTTQDVHMPEKHLHYSQSMGWDQNYFMDKAGHVGEHFKKVIEHILNSKQFTEQTYNACVGLLRLKEKYGNSRLEAASQRALLGASITYRSISAILSNGTDRQLSMQENTAVVPRHDNIRGPENYY